MEQYIQGLDEQVQYWAHIEDVKESIDAIYKDRQFYSFSLHTLELTRRFLKYYSLCKDQNDTGSTNFKKLLLLAETLDERMTREEK